MGSSSLQCAGSHANSRGSAVPTRSPPLPSPTHSDSERKSAQNGTTAGTAAGAFWTTPYAQDAKQDGSSKGQGLDSPRLRSGSPGSRSRREDPSSHHAEKSSSSGSNFLKKKSAVTNLIKKVPRPGHSSGGWGRDDHDHNGYEMRYDSDDQRQADEDEVKGRDSSTLSASSPAPKANNKPGPSNDPAFNDFAAHFDTSAATETAATSSKSSKNHEVQVELDRVNKELQQALAEKAAVSSKFEKLTAFCESQQREIQSLRHALLGSTNNSPRPSSKAAQPPSPVSPQVQTPRQPPKVQTQRQPPKGWQAFDQVCSS